MELPFSNNIKTSMNGDALVISIQTKTKYKPQPHHQKRLDDGFLLDPYLYLHQTIDLTSGEVVNSYTAPPDF